MHSNHQQKPPEPAQTPAAGPPTLLGPPQLSLKEQIAGEADLLRKILSETLQLELSFNPICMMQIDYFISLVLKCKSPPDANGLIRLFGSYYGECLRRCYGGEWRLDAQGVRYLHGIAGVTLHAYPYNATHEAIVDREPGKVFAAGKSITAHVYDAVYQRFFADPAPAPNPEGMT